MPLRSLRGRPLSLTPKRTEATTGRVRTIDRAAALLAAALLAAAGLAVPAGAEGPPAPEPAERFAALDTLLARYVTPEGVRYRAWSRSEEDRAALERVVAEIAAARPSRLPRYERLAFWINAYNALTLDLVLDHYPVDSIKDIRSPWKRKLVTVEGRELSLNEIENDILRKQWSEPRVHFALNCASRSCPPLRPEIYVGARLDAQLEEQTAAFLGDESVHRIDGRGRLHLSRVLDWYREDFERGGIPLLEWLRPYIAGLAALEPGRDLPIRFEPYDWSLNEAPE